MIAVKNVTKKYGTFKALDGLELNVEQGSVYGLVGTNGAGKTTVIKNIIGSQRPDAGEILLGGKVVYENPEVKSKIGYVPDEMYFLPGYSLKDTGEMMRDMYPDWNEERMRDLADAFGIDINKKLMRFSKGMQKQAAMALALSVMPQWLILDEPIDGLDPVARRVAWKCIIDDVALRNTTVLISSHNLREMEGYCDYIGIISEGKMIIERELEDLKSDVHKVQIAYKNDRDESLEGLNILHKEIRGSVELLIIRDSREKIESVIGRKEPAVFDMLPLTLEEIFIYEIGGENDEIRGII